MTRKIFNAIMMVAGTILLASIVIMIGYLYGYFEKVQRNGLKDELNLAIVAVEENGIQYLEKVKSNRYRITWIADNGTVLFDTSIGIDNNENHLEREEVRRALKTGEGQSKRYSNTLLEKTMYYAKRIDDGSVLRISIRNATIGMLILGMLPFIFVIIVIALIMSAILASKLSKWVVKPLNDLDLEHPLENNTYEEISPLLNRINRQHKKIDAQFSELQKKAAEFTQITSYMKEGLVLMDKQGRILSINPAANKIFALKQNSVGKDFLTIYRDYEINLCIKEALESGHGEIQVSKLGREYQFDISCIESVGEVVGAVLLIFDITEKVLAERNRREFTANVSHELKTPLQGIIGSAELIENGIVKQEDLPRFVGYIRKEAARLVTLVGDIIRLSQLDEKIEFERETVNLYEIAEEAIENLKPAAEKKNIKIKIEGRKVVIFAVKKLLYEILYNLCDNAIKYNKDNGIVDLKILNDNNKAIMIISDTGIGIPQEHIGRVFERFYRVDKSHSKDSGGTGLGLSIVKHAVAYHHGIIEIQSETGKGTRVRIELKI